MSDTKLLLTTVFKPFAVNDRYSRIENIPELMMSQITKVQGLFCYRAWHANAGLHLMAANCGVETTVLEWPSIDEFVREITQNNYTHIGITFIPSTFEKMREMVSLVRKLSSGSNVVIGGHGVMIPKIEYVIDVDYICRGEGIRFLRNLFNMSPNFDFKHPVVKSAITEYMGIPTPRIQVGALVTGIGCRNGCEFCVTSAFFNCVYQPFLRKGSEIYHLLKSQHEAAHFKSFWIIDENFLSEKSRAIEFCDEIKNDISALPDITIDMMWSTAELVQSYSPAFLAQLGITKIWMGYESMYADYQKNRNVDFRNLIKNLSEYGISVLLSCTAFTDRHNLSTWEKEVDVFVGLGQAFSQFLPLTAFPGTPFYAQMENEGRVLSQLPYEDMHALSESNRTHAAIPFWQQGKLINEAYVKEYYINGPGQIRDIVNRAKGCLTMQKSEDVVLKKRGNYLAMNLKNQLPWVIASKDYVAKESHRVIVDEAIDVISRIMGVENNRDADSMATDLKKMIERGLKNKNLQREPSLRITKYRDNGLVPEKEINRNVR